MYNLAIISLKYYEWAFINYNIQKLNKLLNANKRLQIKRFAGLNIIYLNTKVNFS